MDHRIGPRGFGFRAWQYPSTISPINGNNSCKSFSTNTFCDTRAVYRRFIPVLIVIMSVRTWLALTSSLSTLVSSYKCWQFGIEGFTSISHLPSHLELQWPICQLSRLWLGWLSSLAACKHAARHKSSQLTAEHGALTLTVLCSTRQKNCFHSILHAWHSLESWKLSKRFFNTMSKTECVTLIQLKTFVLILRWKIL